jgi:cysteine desulfurase
MTAYLDNAATTPLSDAARTAMEPFLSERFGNASEPHRLGRQALAALEDARERLAQAVGAEPHQVIFTSGGTEASNQAVFGLAGRDPGRVVASAIEHSAVREPALELARRGFDVAWAPVDRDGAIVVGEFAELVQAGDRLAAAMWANNVTGVVQPIAELAAICRERDVPLHTDAVQALAGGRLDFAGSGAETMALSAHKVGGPKGVGALIARAPTGIPPLILGGGQEGGRRSGTENVAGIVGFVAAVEDNSKSDPEPLRDRLESALPERVGAISAAAMRLPGTSLLQLPGIRAELAVLALDRAGFTVSAGSACASGDSSPSHVLIAQGLSPADARCVIRVSIGRATTVADIDGFAAALATTVAALTPGALA